MEAGHEPASGLARLRAGWLHRSSLLEVIIVGKGWECGGRVWAPPFGVREPRSSSPQRAREEAWLSNLCLENQSPLCLGKARFGW